MVVIIAKMLRDGGFDVALKGGVFLQERHDVESGDVGRFDRDGVLFAGTGVDGTPDLVFHVDGQFPAVAPA